MTSPLSGMSRWTRKDRHVLAAAVGAEADILLTDDMACEHRVRLWPAVPSLKSFAPAAAIRLSWGRESQG
jgi:hypothetical protein